MARQAFRLLANGGRGIFSVFYHGLTRRAEAEQYLQDGTLCYKPNPHKGEATIAEGQWVFRQDNVPVLVPGNKDGTGPLYLYDVAVKGQDGCEIVPAEKACQCDHCGAWIAPELNIGVHYDGCPEQK